MDDEDAAAKPATLFLGDFREPLAAPSAAVGDGRSGRVGVIAHRMKGSRSAPGSDQLVEICSALELEQIQAEFAQVQVELASVVEAAGSAL